MLSTVTEYLFGSSAAQADTATPVDLKTEDNKEGWVIVDVNEPAEEVEPVANRTRHQQQMQQEQQQTPVVAIPSHRQPQLVAPSAGINVKVQAVRAIKQHQRKATRRNNRNSLERCNKARDFQSCGKKQRQRNKNLCKSGALNARYGQR